MAILLTIILFISSCFYVYSQERNDSVVCAPVRMVPEEELAFRSGEKLSYVIQYRCLGIRSDVGKASVTLSQANEHDGRKMLKARAIGSTFKFWDAFFKVRDLYESVFYMDNVRPFYFHRSINEGGYFIENIYHWRADDDSIQVRLNRRNREPFDTLLPGLSCTYDLLTLFYQARNMNFAEVEKNVKNPLSFAIDEEMFDIYFRFIGPETKKVPGLGTFRTLKFAAMVVAGEVFDGKNELFIWLSDDRNKIPLLFESPIIVGTVVGKLSDFDNLKFPLECKIK